jgi:FixJ family two-component response regulator
MDMNIYREAMQLGALDYLEKPVNTAQIMKMVSAHTRQPTGPV